MEKNKTLPEYKQGYVDGVSDTKKVIAKDIRAQIEKCRPQLNFSMKKLGIKKIPLVFAIGEEFSTSPKAQKLNHNIILMRITDRMATLQEALRRVEK